MSLGHIQNIDTDGMAKGPEHAKGKVVEKYPQLPTSQICYLPPFLLSMHPLAPVLELPKTIGISVSYSMMNFYKLVPICFFGDGPQLDPLCEVGDGPQLDPLCEVGEDTLGFRFWKQE